MRLFPEQVRRACGLELGQIVADPDLAEKFSGKNLTRCLLLREDNGFGGGGVDSDRPSTRVDEPDQAATGSEVLTHFSRHLRGRIAFARHFNRKIGSEWKNWIAGAAMVRQPSAGNERQVGNPHKAGRQKEHTPFAGESARFAAPDEVSQETSQLDRQGRLPITQDLLHQNTVDELEEAALAIMDLDDIVLGGRSRRGTKANSAG
jgi:hypothetical protein